MAKKKAEFRLRPEAVRDLESVWLYTRERWGQVQADRYIDEFAVSFQVLAESPELAPSCTHIRPGYRRMLVGRHAVYFRCCPWGIDITRVLHARMDAPRHL